MQIEREFIERRASDRRATIRAGIAALHDRRGAAIRADNQNVSNWIAKFDAIRAKGN
jgi:hypothetical protein